MFGRRRSDGLLSPITCQRAPGANPRRSTWTPPIPGHQSRMCPGSAMNAQTSSGGASSSRSASYFGTRAESKAEKVPNALPEELEDVPQGRRDGDRERDREQHERPDPDAPGDEPRDALRIDEDLPHL